VLLDPSLVVQEECEMSSHECDKADGQHPLGASIVAGHVIAWHLHRSVACICSLRRRLDRRLDHCTASMCRSFLKYVSSNYIAIMAKQWQISFPSRCKLILFPGRSTSRNTDVRRVQRATPKKRPSIVINSPTATWFPLVAYASSMQDSCWRAAVKHDT
jgi:hypothetical protein